MTPAPMRMAAPPVIKAALSATTASSLRGLTWARAALSQDGGFSSAWPSESTSTPARLEVRDIGQVRPEIAFDDHQAIGREAGELAAKGAGEVGLAHRDAFGLQQRIDVGQPGAQVGIFPGLDAAMRQAEPAVGLDGLAPQARHEVDRAPPGSAFPAASNMSR